MCRFPFPYYIKQMCLIMRLEMRATVYITFCLPSFLITYTLHLLFLTHIHYLPSSFFSYHIYLTFVSFLFLSRIHYTFFSYHVLYTLPTVFLLFLSQNYFYVPQQTKPFMQLLQTSFHYSWCYMELFIL